MKATKKIILVTFAALFCNLGVFAQSQELMAEFSLFNEYQKTDHVSAYPFGWNVINQNPEPFIRYKIFSKMEDVLFYMHDSAATSEEEKQMYADTTLHFYDVAIQYEPDKKGYYLAKKAYVLQEWTDAEVDSIIKVYEAALEADPSLDNYYKDRFGQLLANNASANNDYKMRALELYSEMAEKEPDNSQWLSRIEDLAEDMDELVDIKYRAWQLDKDNPEKAWSYASTAFRNQDFDKAVEALEFLVEKNPDVINYWNQLATAYRRLGNTSKAIDAYKKLINLQPDNREHYLNIALMYKDLDQLSVARSYLNKASEIDPSWDYPVYVEGTLYEQAARNCGFEFMDKLVYQLAVNTYRRAANLGGNYSSVARERIEALSKSVPSQEDYFFRDIKSGDEIKIEGRCYDWVNRSVTVP